MPIFYALAPKWSPIFLRQYKTCLLYTSPLVYDGVKGHFDAACDAQLGAVFAFDAAATADVAHVEMCIRDRSWA